MNTNNPPPAQAPEIDSDNKNQTYASVFKKVKKPFLLPQEFDLQPPLEK